jgi:hypothetical protein
MAGIAIREAHACAAKLYWLATQTFPIKVAACLMARQDVWTRRALYMDVSSRRFDK